MAAMAALLTADGAGKSGNPCERFTPPWRSLSRVISRITDSVNCVAFFDPVSLDMIWEEFYADFRGFLFRFDTDETEATFFGAFFETLDVADADATRGTIDGGAATAAAADVEP